MLRGTRGRLVSYIHVTGDMRQACELYTWLRGTQGRLVSLYTCYGGHKVGL